jgi:hypothetical protein
MYSASRHIIQYVPAQNPVRSGTYYFTPYLPS